MKQISNTRMSLCIKPDYRLSRWSLFLVASALAFGQGTATRPKAGDYPVRVKAAGFELAAEYLVHSLPSPKGAFFVNDYLVIEVAVFPDPKTAAQISAQNFVLRINGKKTTLLTQAPGMVAASLKYPDWEQRPTLVGQAGIGDGGIIVGRPPVTDRFPGDPTQQQSRLPRAPRVPDQSRPEAVEREPEEPIEKVCQRLALPEGSLEAPASGYLFFPFHGKTKSIHSLELVFESASGVKATLPLF